MVDRVLEGRYALITGASSGLGADLARVLAWKGCNLCLVARRVERLQQLKAQITQRFPGTEIDIMPMDLSEPDAPERLYARIQELGKQVDVLINNAGYGLYGYFADIPWQKEQNMLELDIVAVVHMTKVFLPDMLRRNFGYILQIASIGAYQPSPLYATYSAAKSFVLNFGEALNYELRKTRVRCTVLSPGVTATEFLQVAGQDANVYQRMTRMRSLDVARIGIDSMLKGRPSVIPGRMNSLMAWSNRFLPRRLSAALAHRLMQ